jgi:hypothetical protein
VRGQDRWDEEAGLGGRRPWRERLELPFQAPGTSSWWDHGAGMGVVGKGMGREALGLGDP